MKKIYFGVLLILVLFLAGCKSGTTGSAVKDTTLDKKTAIVNDPKEMMEEKDKSAKENIIEITSSGFTPNDLKIKRGEKVTWINKDTTQHWPASAIHPTHEKYPGSSITKCGTSELIFDACKGLPQGESWSFTFNEKGTWPYHDHTNAKLFGKVTVE